MRTKIEVAFIIWNIPHQVFLGAVADSLVPVSHAEGVLATRLERARVPTVLVNAGFFHRTVRVVSAARCRRRNQVRLGKGRPEMINKGNQVELRMFSSL